MADEPNGTRQAEIYLHQDSKIRTRAGDPSITLIPALANLLDVSSQAIGVAGVYDQNTAFELKLPPPAARTLHSLLQSNSSKLRLLGVEQVLIEKDSGEIEAWVSQDKKFNLTASRFAPQAQAQSNASTDAFYPIENIWVFHLAYFCVTLLLGWSFSPHPPYVSLFLIAAASIGGLFLSYYERFMAAQILAVAFIFGSPVVLFGRLAPWETGLLFAGLIGGLTLIRRYIF